MSTIWKIDEAVAPVEPPADSLVGDDTAQELTTEDLAASAAGVELPDDAEGVPS